MMTRARHIPTLMPRIALIFGLLAIVWAWPTDAAAHPAPQAHATAAQDAAHPGSPAGTSTDTCCHHDGTCSAKMATPDTAPPLRDAAFGPAHLPTGELPYASLIGGADPPPPRG